MQQPNEPRFSRGPGPASWKRWSGPTRHALVFPASRAPAVEAAITASLEIPIKAIKVSGIESHLRGRWHAFVWAPLGEDAPELLSARDVAGGLEREDETGGEGRALGVFTVAASALQAVLLPAPIGRDIDRVASGRVVGVSGHACRN